MTKRTKVLLQQRIVNETGDELESAVSPKPDLTLSEDPNELWYPPRVEMSRSYRYKVSLYFGGVLKFETPWKSCTGVEARSAAERMLQAYQLEFDEYRKGHMTEQQLPTVRMERITVIQEDVSAYLADVVDFYKKPIVGLDT